MTSETTPEADLFWDDSDPEYSFNDLIEVVSNYGDGEIVRVRCAAILPDVFAVRVGDDMQSFATMAEAKAWADQKEKERADGES